MKKWMIAALIISLFFFSSCRAKRAEEKIISGVDKKVGRYSYKKENLNLIIIVDTETARMRKKEKYFPLDIKVANKDLDSLTLTRENVFLLDEKGNRYHMASVEEILRDYDKLLLDSRFRDEGFVVGNKIATSFEFFIQEKSNFFPVKAGAGRVTDSVIIGRNRFIEDRLYFPMLPEGIEGKKLKLLFEVPELDFPLEVSFFVE